MKPTYILGLNTFHADSSAVLVPTANSLPRWRKRLNRVKHFAGFRRWRSRKSSTWAASR